MLFPRFSLRTTLLTVTACAVFFVVLGQAYQGQAWAVVISVGVTSIFVTLAVHAGMYVMASALGRVVGAEVSPARTSQGGLQTSLDDQLPPDLNDPAKNR